MSIAAKEVPAELWGRFDHLVNKSAGFYTGYLRCFWHRGDFAYVDTRFDEDLIALGLLEREGSATVSPAQPIGADHD